MLYQESQEYLEALTNLSIESEVETNNLLCLNSLYRLGNIQESYKSFHKFYKKNGFISGKQFKLVKKLLNKHDISFDAEIFNVNEEYVSKKPVKKRKFKSKKKKIKNY